MSGFIHVLKAAWEFLAGFLVGFTFKWILVWRSSRTTIHQSGNVVGGNLAGHDVITREVRRK